MEGYIRRLFERMHRIPNGEKLHQGFLELFDIRQAYPWAKSVVIAAVDNTRFYLSRAARKHYGKLFLTDNRFNSSSPGRGMILGLTTFMEGLGLKVYWNDHPGVTGLRWAAQEAGLGIIRRNNFFFTPEAGSYVSLTGWVTDADMELIAELKDEPCPAGCTSCFDACPTGSLSEPFTMNMATCVSTRNSYTDSTVIDDERFNTLNGSWLYGCDQCQDSCPFNQALETSEDLSFPGLDDLEPYLLPEVIASLKYEAINQILRPKFFYIKSESLWRWKLNAINVLVNTKSSESIKNLKKLLNDPFDIVRRRARNALDQLFASHDWWNPNYFKYSPPFIAESETKEPSAQSAAAPTDDNSSDG
jgi:epoxyqueuosine reductase